MRKNQTLHLIREQQLAVGTWLQLQSVAVARALAAQGCFNWLLVDMEHTPVDLSTASGMLATIADITGGQCTPLARVPAGTIDHIKRALDCGAQGVLVPLVNTAEEAAAAVRYARYPPEGERGGGGFAPHLGFGVNRSEYMQQVNAEILVGIQIETRAALLNLDAILDVPGLDLIFIGPNDLHLSLGLPGRFWSAEPDFLAAVEQVKVGCRQRGLPLGILCADAISARARLAEGFTFIGISTDAQLLLTYAGLQYGTLFDLPEPPQGWGNQVRLSQ